jgi:hypothetical protein
MANENAKVETREARFKRPTNKQLRDFFESSREKAANEKGRKLCRILQAFVEGKRGAAQMLRAIDEATSESASQQ